MPGRYTGVMTRGERVSITVRVLAAAAIFARLGGVAWLPPAPVLAALLLAWLAVDAVRRADGRLAWRRSGFDWYAVALAALLVLTVLVRLPSLSADLGHQPPDIDGHRLGASIRHFFLTGSVEHTTVEHYPGIVFWAMAATSLGAYLSGLMRGSFASVLGMPVESFMFAARLTNVLAAAGTVACTAGIARRLGGRGAAIGAAAIVAFVPLAVDTSTATRNDSGQVLLLVAAVWATLVAFDSGSTRWLAVAGVFGGLATGAKYTSAFILVPALVAAVSMRPAADRIRRALTATAGFAAAVAVTNHFLWWDFANFVRQLSDQVAITGPGHWAASANPAAMHRTVLATLGPGWPLLMLGAAWGAWGLARGRDRAWLFWSFPLLYSWFTTHRPSQFARWVYPLLPFVAVAGACGVAVAVAALSRWPGWGRIARGPAARAVVATLLVGVTFGPPLWAGAVTISRRMTPSTARVLESWLRDRVPAGNTVLLEDGWLDLREAPFGVMRVPNLAWVLAPGRNALAAADWVVVPETHFGNPALTSLALMKQVAADQRSFGGNLGFDYRVYVTPRLAPVEVVDLALDDPAAAPALGSEWETASDGQPGRLLPDRSAALYLPPPAHDEVSIEVDVAGAGDTPAGPPLVVTLAGDPITLTDVASPAPGVRRLVGRLQVRHASRAVEMRLDPVRRGARLRVLRVHVG